MGTTENVQAWSTTTADNDDADAGINWTEGQDPATVNNSARGMMTAVKNYVLDTDGGLVASGTDTLTLTTNQDLEAAHVAAGLTLSFRVANTNTGAVTLNPDSTGAVAVVDQNGDALTGGELVAGMMATVMYNSNTSNWRLVSGLPVSASPVAYFLAHKNGADQTVTTRNATQVTFGTEDADVGSHFASNAWTPPAGLVLLQATVGFEDVSEGGANISKVTLSFYKDGSEMISTEVRSEADSLELGQSIHLSAFDVADGTDVYTVYVTGADGTLNWTVQGETTRTRFSGVSLSSWA